MRIQSITNLTNDKISLTKLKFNNVTPAFKANGDAFIRSEKSILCTIKDVCEYLSRNKSKVEDGKIFNKPINNGDSLLMQFLHITPLESEMPEYKSLLFDMARMDKIDYNQKDSLGMSALEWIMTREEPLILSLIIGKELTKDQMLENTYKSIKNPEFRNELIRSDIYRPQVYATPEEQEIFIDTMLNQNELEADTSIQQEIIKSMRNNEGYISNETSAILRQVLKTCNQEELADLPEFMNKIKDSSGKINLEETASIIAKKEQDKLTLKEVINQLDMDEDAKAYMDTAKKYLDSEGIKWIQDKDGLLIISNFDPRRNRDDIDYNRLFKCIKAVIGLCNFANVKITDYGNLQYICGSAFLNFGADSMGKIESIGIDVDFGYPRFQRKHREKYIYSFIQGLNMKSTGNLKRIGGTANFANAFELKEVPNLEYVEKLVLNAGIGPEENVFKDVEIGELVILGRY